MSPRRTRQSALTKPNKYIGRLQTLTPLHSRSSSPSSTYQRASERERERASASPIPTHLYFSDDMKEASDFLPSTATVTPKRPPSPAGPLPGRGGRYKLWALAAVLLLALWSMLTGSVTLRWSARRPSDDLDGPALEDLDVLEMEERQKVVRHMWDVYAHSHRTGRLPRFWQEAFEAAYEELAGDEPASRDAAVAEIARLSMRMVDLEAPAQKSKNADELEKNERNGDGRPRLNSSSSLPSVKAH